MLLFRALAKNMAPMTNADESPTNRLTLFPIYLSLFIVSTLCPREARRSRLHIEKIFLNPTFYSKILLSDHSKVISDHINIQF